MKTIRTTIVSLHSKVSVGVSIRLYRQRLRELCVKQFTYNGIGASVQIYIQNTQQIVH